MRQSKITIILIACVIFATLFENQTITAIQFIRTPFAIAGIVLAIYFVFSSRGKLSVALGPESWAVFMCFGFAFLSLLHLLIYPDMELTGVLKHYFYIIQPVILFLVLSALSRRSQSEMFNWFVFVAMAAVMAITSVATSSGGWFGGLEARGGYEGVNLNRQAYAYVLSIMTLIWLMLKYPKSITKRHVARFVVLVSFVLLTLAFLRAGSRGAFLVLLAGVALIFLSEIRKKTIPAYVVIFAPVVIVFGLLLTETGLILERMEAALSGQSTGMRDVLMEAAVSLSAERPILGHSYQYFDRLGLMVFESSRRIDVHNGIFQLVLSFGYVGLLLWFGFLMSVFRRLWSHRGQPAARLFLVLFCTNMIFMLIGSLLTNIYFWLFLGSAVNAHHINGSPLAAASRTLRRLIGRSKGVLSGDDINRRSPYGPPGPRVR